MLRVLHREPVIGVGGAQRRPDDGRDEHSSQELAARLPISARIVEQYPGNMFTKLDIASRANLR